MNFREQLKFYGGAVEEKLEFYINSIKQQGIVPDAMHYSLMNGGKRIRPVLALAFCEVSGGSMQSALPYACAVEMIHTYSLIHDDLPCMDDDDLRRGKPSCHKQFGESYALLAGDGLLNSAFEILFNKFGDIKDANTALKAGCILSSASGIDGMIGGQALDLLSEGVSVSLDKLKTIHSLKTGAMIIAPCKIGAVCAGASEKEIADAEEYGRCIGLAFQIVDDILDTTGDEAKLGKPIGSDEANGKSTYTSVMGISEASAEVSRLTEKAVKIAENYGEKGAFLKELALNLASRER